jgi:hypothetical protein
MGSPNAFGIPVGTSIVAPGEDWSPLLTHVRNAPNKFDGPSGENGGYDRRNRWSTACLRIGIRLKDFIGQSLWTLPLDNKYEDESSDERSDDDFNDDDK